MNTTKKLTLTGQKKATTTKTLSGRTAKRQATEDLRRQAMLRLARTMGVSWLQCRCEAAGRQPAK